MLQEKILFRRRRKRHKFCLGIRSSAVAAKPQTPYVVTPDGSLPIEYHNMLDPLTTLTYVAGVTERIS